jgi:Alkylmercury lyase
MDPATAHDNTDRSDRAIRLAIYRHFAETGQAPTAADVARALDQSPSAVEDAYRRLAAGRAIVLAPGTSNIWMAHPFSASPTPYRVRTPRGAYWANCAWDALNIAALLGVDAHVNARCPDCNDELALVIRSGTLQAPEGVIHFAVPPRHFWENIGFT